jgi:RNA recognition motif-containing protein
MSSLHNYDQVVGYNKKTIIYVGGLEEKVTEDDLMLVFIAFGEIVKVQMPREQGETLHRGFGFVEFEHAKDAKAAIENMQDSMLNNRVLKVNYAKPDSMKREAIWTTQEGSATS